MAKGFSKRFYSSKLWKAVRDSYVSERIQADGGLCECCHTEPGIEVHHIVPLTPENINDPDVTINPDNLEYLCKFCHFEKHKEFILNRMERVRKKRILTDGKYFDEQGQIQPLRIYIVYGPPYGGQREYVTEHRHPEDLVLDLDAIKMALGSSGDNLTRLAFDIRDLVLKEIEERTDKIDCRSCWIIAGLPKRDKRHELADRLQAKLILVSEEHNEVRQRIMDDDEQPRKIELLTLAAKWYEDYEPD